MITKFVARNGETFRLLHQTNETAWLISCDNPTERPFCVMKSDLESFQPVPAPQEFVLDQSPLSSAAQQRLELIQPLLEQDIAVLTDRQLRNSIAKDIAVKHNTTLRRVIRLYYRYLATGQLISYKQREVTVNDTYEWAIKTFYFSAKKFSLRAAYDMMLVQQFMSPAGKLPENIPSWQSFRSYYYSRNYHKDPRKLISRSGLSSYQRNNRPAFGTASDWRGQPGSYQMDATQADIYLVSRHDRSKVIGRPYVYLAVDTATQLITGLYVGLECDETSVMHCLTNAVQDKVSYCKEYGINIEPAQWPNCGLPYEIVTDKGSEFSGTRIQELCKRFGLEIHSLPPYRPDDKGLVEKSFDLIQQKYKPLLAGKGVIEPDAQERWATDYRSQSVLDLDEFTKIVIYCILYLNAGRSLADFETPAQKWIAAAPSLMNVSFEELLLMALPRERVKLTRKGLKINRLLYVPTDMDVLTLGETYMVAYSPSDLSCVHIVMDDCTFKRCQLSSVYSQYEGLSQAEAEILNQENRERRSEAEKREVAASVESIQNIQAILKNAVSIGTEKTRIDGKNVKKNRSEERSKLT